MRIVHVSDVYLPRLGGIEMHVHDLAEQQHLRGDRVAVLTGTADGTGRRSRSAADPADRIPVVRLDGPGWSSSLSDVLTRADVVHCHSSVVSPTAWAAARWSARRGIPTVVTMHSVISEARLLAVAWRALAESLGEGVTWTAVSERAAGALRVAVRRQVGVLPNGIDAAAWSATERRTDLPPRPLTLVAVNRLAARKRVLPLVEILAAVRDLVSPDTPLRAVIAGDGPQRGALQRRLRSAGVDGWVELPGRLTRAEIRALYARSDVFVAPARLESFGIAALEARCSGLPVVAMAEAGVCEFIRDGIEGRLVADDDAMAAAIADLIAEPAMLQRMRAHNASTPTSLDWSEVVTACLRMYAYAAAGSGTRDLPLGDGRTLVPS